MGFLDQELVVEIPQKQHFRRTEQQANSLLKKTKARRRGKRRKHKRKIPKMTYHQYMGSAYWKKRKNDYFGAHGKKCAVCGQRYGVTLHHKVYDSRVFGKEPDDHLVPLCQEHHHEFHKHHRLRRDMQKATDLYVSHAKQYDVFISTVPNF
jgi:hypothetical protein